MKTIEVLLMLLRALDEQERAESCNDQGLLRAATELAEFCSVLSGVPLGPDAREVALKRLHDYCESLEIAARRLGEGEGSGLNPFAVAAGMRSKKK